MILTVTMNPSVDTRYQLDELIIDDVNRVTPEKTAGGKGLNVARVLHQFGTSVLATGPLAGPTGRLVAEHAAAAGITLARTSTPNAQPRFAELALDLVDELRTGREPSRVPAAQSVPGYGQSIDGAFCTPECAANARLNPGSR